MNLIITQVLRSNRALTQLSLKNNGVHESGLMEIGNALLTNTNLTSLSLFGNEFSHRTGQVFLNSLKVDHAHARTSLYNYPS